MQNYELIFILTIPLQLFATFFLINSFFLQKRIQNRNIELGIYLIYAFFMGTTYFFTRIPLIFLFLNLLCIFCISLLYDSNFLNRVVKVVSIYSIFLVIELVIATLMGWSNIRALTNSQFNSISGLSLIRLVTLFVAYFIYKFRNNSKRDFKLPVYYYLVNFFILSATLYLYLNSLEKENLGLAQVIISSIILIMINVLVIFIEEKIHSVMLVYNERNILKLQTFAYEKQKGIIDQSIKSMRSVKHDLKNHLIYLNLLYENGKSEEFSEYIKNVLDNVDVNGKLVQSGNFVVDSITNWEIQRILEKDCSIEFKVNIPEKINIASYDLTVILGNLFDNAIKALEDISEKENRKIYFSMEYSKENLIILMENSYIGEINILDGRILTKKMLKNEHGMGLPNIEKTLEKYGGEMQIEYENQLFSVVVLIPTI